MLLQIWVFRAPSNFRIIAEAYVAYMKLHSTASSKAPPRLVGPTQREKSCGHHETPFGGLQAWQRCTPTHIPLHTTDQVLGEPPEPPHRTMRRGGVLSEVIGVGGGRGVSQCNALPCPLVGDRVITTVNTARHNCLGWYNVTPTPPKPPPPPLDVTN